MTGPRIPFLPQASPIEAIDVATLVGDGMSLLVPADEPLSAGLIPVRPSLVTSVVRPYPQRMIRCSTGHPITAPLATKPRPLYSLQWVGINRDERDALLVFFRDKLEGIRYGFDLETDGQDVPASLLTLRFTSDPTLTWAGKAVHQLPALLAEELFG